MSKKQQAIEAIFESISQDAPSIQAAYYLTAHRYFPDTAFSRDVIMEALDRLDSHYLAQHKKAHKGAGGEGGAAVSNVLRLVPRSLPDARTRLTSVYLAPVAEQVPDTNAKQNPKPKKPAPKTAAPETATVTNMQKLVAACHDATVSFTVSSEEADYLRMLEAQAAIIALFQQHLPPKGIPVDNDSGGATPSQEEAFAARTTSERPLNF